MRSFSPYRALVAGAAAAAPALAFAHAGMHEGHDLVHGFMHPLGGLDHVLAMVAIGVIAARLGGRALWALPASFVAAMAVAGICGMAGLGLPDPETAIALSVIVLGAVIARPVRWPATLLAGMVAPFAVFHGYSHGLAMADARSVVAFGSGFVAATVLLHLAGIGLGLALDHAGVSRGLRIARAGGCAIALAGVAILAGALTG